MTAGCAPPAGVAAGGVTISGVTAARVAARGSTAGVGTGGVPIATGVCLPPPAPTGAPLACTVAGRDAHAVERIAPGTGVRLVGRFSLPGLALLVRNRPLVGLLRLFHHESD